MDEDNPGIDYGGGATNIDTETGIRFGVINMNALGCFAWEGVEADYGDPTCGKCGNEVISSSSDEAPEDCHGDYWCGMCEESLESQDAFGEEPHGHILDDGEYKGYVGDDGDLMLVKSPYYTHAQFCSPCAPGAGHLEHPCAEGPKTYALGHEWFESETAPYPVFLVTTGETVSPTEV